MRSRKLPFVIFLLSTMLISRSFCGEKEDFQYALALLGDRQEYALAAEKFEQLFESDHDNPLAVRSLYYLGMCYAKMKKDISAAQTYDKLVGLYPGADQDTLKKSYIYGGDSYFRAGRYDKAIEMYTKLMEKYPGAQEVEGALYWRGECYSRLAAKTKEAQSYLMAVKDFTAIIADYPSSKLRRDCLYGGGVCAYDARDYQQAVKLLQDFRAENATDKRSEEALYYLADSYYWLEEYKKAALYFSDIIRGYPGGRYAAEAHSGIGWCYYAGKDYPKAAASFVKAAEVFGAGDKSFGSYYDAGVAYEQGQLYQKARVAFERAASEKAGESTRIKSLESLGRVMRQLATVEKERGRAYKEEMQQAEKVLSEAVSLIGSNYPLEKAARVAMLLGETRYELGDYQGAAEAFSEVALKWSEKKYGAYALYHLSLALAKVKDYERAAEAIRTLLVSFPESQLRLQAAYAMADYQKELSNTQKSIKAYNWLVDEGRNWAESGKSGQVELAGSLAAKSLLRLGEIYNSDKTMQNTTKARECFAKILKEYPDSSCVPAASLRLGELTEKSGEFAKAEQYYDVSQKSSDKLIGKSSADNNDAELKTIALYSWYRRTVSQVLKAQKEKGANRKAALAEVLVQVEDFIRRNEGSKNKDLLPVKMHYYRAELLYALGRKGEACSDYQVCYDGDAKGSLADAALFGLCWALADTGAKDQSMSRMAELVEKFPASEYVPEVLLAMSAEYREKKNYTSALECTGKIINGFNQKKFTDRARIEEARNYIALNESRRAIAILHEFINSRGDSVQMPEALYVLSWAQWKVAEPLFAKAYNDRSAYEKFTGGISLSDLDRPRAAQAQELNDKWQKSLASARKREDSMIISLVTLQKNYPDYSAMAQVYLRLGESAYDREKYPQAYEYYRKAIASGNKAVMDKAYYRIAWCSLRMGRRAAVADKEKLRTQALTNFIEVCNSCPQSPLAGECAWRGADLLRASRDYQKALWYYDYAKKSNAGAEVLSGAEYGRALTLLEMQEYSASLVAFKEYLAKYPASSLNHEANWGAGYASYKLGAYADAKDYYIKAKSAEYGGEVAAKARYGLGLIALEQKEYKLAREEFRKVDVFHSQWSEVAAAALMKAAEASQLMGEDASAMKDIERVVKFYKSTTHYNKASELYSSIR